jgi:hypothetical protein
MFKGDDKGEASIHTKGANPSSSPTFQNEDEGDD